ncbi:hypothetical protein LTR66_015099 [Elasticomyces elasticus]|nr:hypothetical protein LTR66_015099 [Elasticomyces elasticus]
MHLGRWLSTAIILFLETRAATSSALLHIPTPQRHQNSNPATLGWQAATQPERDHALDRRAPQPASPSPSPLASSSTPGVPLPSTQELQQNNTSTLQSCTSALSTLNSSQIFNSAGYAACYNILSWQNTTSTLSTFQADLRLFQLGDATGTFLSYPANALSVMLHFPSSTQFSVLTNSNIKRDATSASTPVQVQQYSLTGIINPRLDLTQLNTTQLMSLFVPQITISAPANMNGVYFTTGIFSDQVLSTPAIARQAASSTFAANAVASATPFEYPGRTFGIFPTGLIVTGAWVVVFVLAYGLGTYGRLRHRDVYRRRMAALQPQQGKSGRR